MTTNRYKIERVLSRLPLKKKKNMHISPISFTSNENITRRQFIKTGTMGLAGAAIAPAALAQQEPQPQLKFFDRKIFSVFNHTKKLDVAAVSTNGNKDGYNLILANLINNSDNKTTGYFITCVVEPAEGSRLLSTWVSLAELGKKEIKPFNIFEPDVVKYVKGLIEDARHLSPAKIIKAMT